MEYKFDLTASKTYYVKASVEIEASSEEEAHRILNDEEDLSELDWKIFDCDGIENVEVELAKDYYTWDEICERAEDASYGSTELMAKDNAREQVRAAIYDAYNRDIEDSEYPEEVISDFLEKNPDYDHFDENGNICSRGE